MKRKRFGWLSILLTILLTFLITVGSVALTSWLVIGPEGLALLEGLAVIDRRFIGEYDMTKVRDGAMRGMALSLGDRWTYYMTPEQAESHANARNNVYVGIAVTVSYADERGLLLEQIAAGGPAEAAGLQVGELILAVDGQSLAGEARYEGVDYIRGPEGTDITLEVLGTDGERREVTVTRCAIETDPVSYEMLEGQVGYIKLDNFFSRSAKQLNAAVDELQTQGAEALIFDLRNNGGGYLDELTAMLDHLLPEGPIFRSQNRQGEEVVTNSDAECVDLPMAVLVNRNTYSAAEFFAAQLRESGVGVIVGEATFGKGYSQQTFSLPGGGALNLSTAKYFTGSGVSLIGTGVTLDRELSLTENAEEKLSAGTLEHSEDEQLQAALELLEKA